MIIILMLAKIATLGLLKIKLFWNNSHAIISVHDVTKKLDHVTPKYIVDVAMRPKFGNSSISTREVIITSVL